MKELIAEIRARGWGFSVHNVFTPSSGDAPAILEGCTAEVHVSGDGEYSDILYYTDDDDPEQALRAAYDNAMKGEVHGIRPDKR